MHTSVHPKQLLTGGGSIYSLEDIDFLEDLLNILSESVKRSEHTDTERAELVAKYAEYEKLYWPNETNSNTLSYSYLEYHATAKPVLSPDAFAGFCEGDYSVRYSNGSWALVVYMNRRVDYSVVHRMRDVMNEHLVGPAHRLLRDYTNTRGDLLLVIYSRDMVKLVLNLIKDRLVMPYRRHLCAEACEILGIPYDPYLPVLVSNEWFLGMAMADGGYGPDTTKLTVTLRIKQSHLHMSDKIFRDIKRVAHVDYYPRKKGDSADLGIHWSSQLYREMSFRAGEILGFRTHPYVIGSIVGVVSSILRANYPRRMRGVPKMEREYHGLLRLLMLEGCAKWYVGVEHMRKQHPETPLINLSGKGFETIYHCLGLHKRIGWKLDKLLEIFATHTERADRVTATKHFVESLMDRDFYHDFINHKRVHPDPNNPWVLLNNKANDRHSEGAKEAKEEYYRRLDEIKLALLEKLRKIEEKQARIAARQAKKALKLQQSLSTKALLALNSHLALLDLSLLDLDLHTSI